MTKIIISGASGQFGRAAAELLLASGPAERLILTSRTPAKLADLAARGADVRFADFDDAASLDAAFAGGDRMLLISTARVGSRVQQHQAAIDAAARAGVRHIAYTSFLNVDRMDNPAIVTLDHRATEDAVRASGLAWTFLRDSQYAEAVGMAIAPLAVQNGRVPGSAGDGRVAFVSRDDCVACAAAVLDGDGHENQAYDLTGPELFTFPQTIALIARMAGTPIEYVRVTDDGMFDYFDSLGVPRHASDDANAAPIPWSSDDMVTFEQAIREGFLDVRTDCVERLTGRPPRTLESVLDQYRASWPQPAAA